MNTEKIKQRIEFLLKRITKTDEETTEKISAIEIHNATFNLVIILYGDNSPQFTNFKAENEHIKTTPRLSTHRDFYQIQLCTSTLENLLSEIEWGLIGSLQKSITGEVLTDFLQLSRAALEEKGDDAKNVSAVLTAALFEDTIRRLATVNVISHTEKLADVLTELKNQGVLDGTQVGVAQSYLTFRNKSLHAEWDKVGRETVASVMAFTEQLLLKHFS